MELIANLLHAEGIESQLLARDPERPNLVARLPGRGTAPGLLLHGHLDVVPANAAEWRHPPFGGDVIDGEVWGRGALDMKSGVAMIVCAFLRTAEQFKPAGDLVLALTSDEETGSTLGAKYLVENHARLFDGVRYALGEIGGFTWWVAGCPLYPIHIAEKQRCEIRATLRGPGGHASTVVEGTAAAKTGAFLQVLSSRRLPVRMTPVARLGIEALADALPQEHGRALRRLVLSPRTDPGFEVLGAAARVLDPLVRNTATPTVIHGGGSSNVIPTEITVHLDVRMVPGATPTEVIDELEELAPGLALYDVLHEEPASHQAVDMTLFPLLADVTRQHDPAALPVPMLLAGYTDARYFSRLGICTYGYLPMRLPPGMSTDLIHAPDERIPAAAVGFGTDCVFDVIRRYSA